jgi:hypothetical protein
VGNVQSPVRGVAVCYAPTIDVLRRAAAESKNLILSREHPYFLHGGLHYAYTSGGLEAALKDDPVTQAKREIIAANQLMVLRRRRPTQLCNLGKPPSMVPASPGPTLSPGTCRIGVAWFATAELRPCANRDRPNAYSQRIGAIPGERHAPGVAGVRDRPDTGTGAPPGPIQIDIVAEPADRGEVARHRCFRDLTASAKDGDSLSGARRSGADFAQGQRLQAPCGGRPDPSGYPGGAHMVHPISRRCCSAIVRPCRLPAQGPVTAAQAVERIKKKLAEEKAWRGAVEFRQVPPRRPSHRGQRGRYHLSADSGCLTAGLRGEEELHRGP